MAIIIFGPMVVGARGTAGGLIFTANKSGPYVRSWSKGANPRTALQATQRNRLTDFSKRWQDLTQAERDDWIDYADDPPQELTNSLGETYFASGFNWYIRINTHLDIAGAAARDDAPTLTRPIAPTIQSFVARFTGAAFESRIDYTGEGPELAELHGITARAFESSGRLAVAANFTSMTIAVPDVIDQVTFQPELEAAFGTIILDQRIFIETYIQDAHGQRGPLDTAFDDAGA